jgi:hypothetical protein
MRDEIHATLTVVTHSHDLAALMDPAERTRRGDRPPRRRRAGVALAVVLLPIGLRDGRAAVRNGHLDGAALERFYPARLTM